MNRNFAIVLGGSSFIARSILTKIDLDVDEVIFLTRKKSKGSIPVLPKKSRNFELDERNELTLEKIACDLDISHNTSIIVFNLVGTLGNIFDVRTSDEKQFNETFQLNMNPFISSLAIFNKSGPNSIYINFSGAGIGGENLEDMSYGYVCAKASMVILVELLQRQFLDQRKFICSISPGAFPSQMQLQLLNPEVKSRLSAKRLDSLKNLQSTGGSTDNLVQAIQFIINNPESVGGRMISANFDDFNNLNFSKDFGKLRRITE